MAFLNGGLWLPVGPSLIFFLINAVILCLILRDNQKKPKPQAPPAREEVTKGTLPASEVLGWEFAYASTTASEAMTERHGVVNIYLLAAGVVISGVAAVLSLDTEPAVPAAAGTLLLWLLCLIGWVYFLAILRLRQAWRESATAMNQIKDFYIQHASGFPDGALGAAFRWKSETLPRAGKKWTVYFYSAMLIALLNSGAYVVGGLLLAPQAPYEFEWYHLALLSLLGLAFFGYHVWLYFSFLQD